MSSTSIRLSPEQRAIVEARGNVVVVAGAGTGKTETLTQRVLHALTTNQEYSLRELIVLTFTDKAAGEMRQRIYRGLLQRLVNATDDAARRHWSTLCAGFAETHRIGTFDAFNHRLLAAYPEYQLVPNSFTPMTDYDERQLQARLARSFWDWLESLETDAPERRDFFELLEDFERKQILKLLNILAAEEKEQLEKLALLPGEGEYRNELRALTARFAPLLERREARRLNRLWRNYEHALQSHFSDLPPVLSEVLHDPEQLKPRTSEVLLKSGGFRKKWIAPEWKELCAQIEEQTFPFLGLWQKAEAQLALTLENFARTDESWENDWRVRRHLARAARLASWWAQKREEICRREGWLDFASAHRAALMLLEENEEVAARLRAGCRFVLVDEFQDTNFAQWRLVAAFASPENVMLIGDGKQSIYGFRGGDITVFDEVRRDVLQVETPHGLSLSQRATPELTQFFNDVFREILPDENDPEREAWEAPFQELTSARESEENSGVYLIEAAPENQALQNSENNEEPEIARDSNRESSEMERLAEATALLLREIQDDADGGEGAPLRRPEFKKISAMLRENRPATIGVLFSTHSAKAIFETELRRRGVRYARVKGTGFFQSQPVYDAINLLRFLFDSSDDFALAGVLRAPLFGASDLALLELKRVVLQNASASFWEALQARSARRQPIEFQLSEEDERVLLRAKSLLSQWRERAQVEPISAVLEAVEFETEFVFARALRDDATQQGENWRKVLDIVRDREQRGQGSARALAEYFSEQAESEEREADADLPEGGAIQLMTVFASKGLGFPMTIVAQTNGLFRIDADLLRKGAIENRDEILYALNCKDSEGKEQKNLLWEILKETERAQREAEWARLFYVACTRASDYLLLAMPQAAKVGSWAEMATPFVEQKKRFKLGELSQRARRQAQQRGETPFAGMPLIPSPLVSPDLLCALPENAIGREASVTQLIAPHHKNLAPFARASESRRQRVHGTVFHRLLRAGVEASERARIESFVATGNLPLSHVDFLQRQLTAAQSWLNGQNLDLTRAQYEVAFSIPADAARGVLPAVAEQTKWVNGTLDLLVPREQSWVVIDFKTHRGQLAPGDLIRQNRYDEQVRIYCAAAEYSGLRVEEGWLVFLDEDGAADAQRIV